jgi:hypothetical protein
MNRIINRASIIIWLSLLTIVSASPVLAGNSISAQASCHVPFLITMSDGKKVSAESINTNQETIITEQNRDLLTKEITTDKDGEVKLINTVCAK